MDRILNEMLEYPRVHCQPFPANSVFAPFLILVRYANIFITVGLYAMSLRYHEIYLLFFSFGLSLDTIVNVALVHLLRGAVPILGCGGPYDMPSVIAQHTGFFITSILIYSYQYNAPHIHTLHHALLAGWATLVPFAMAFFNFNSPEQLIVAYLVGSLLAFVWQIAFTFPLIVPRFPEMLEWRIMKFCGYQDTMCQEACDIVAVSDSSIVAYQYVPASAQLSRTPTSKV